jgi:D-inositol-3-phosphate glycosyltransferase
MSFDQRGTTFHDHSTQTNIGVQNNSDEMRTVRKRAAEQTGDDFVNNASGTEQRTGSMPVSLASVSVNAKRSKQLGGGGDGGNGGDKDGDGDRERGANAPCERNAPNKNSQAPLDAEVHVVFCDRWSYQKGGIATFNLQFCAALASSGDFRVCCALDNPNDGEKREAAKAHVAVIDSSDSESFFGALPQSANKLFFYGHANITGKQAVTMSKLVSAPKLVRVALFNHILPASVDRMKKQDADAVSSRTRQMTPDDEHEMLVGLAMECDLVLSVGQLMFVKFDDVYKFRRAAGSLRPVHKVFIPLMNPLFLDKPRNEKVVSAHYVLCIGRIAEKTMFSKGLVIAKRAMMKYNEGHRKNFEVHFLGADPANSERLYEKLGGISTTHIIDYKKPELVLERVHNASLVLMPSPIEPFGLVAYEAIACGVPTLVTSNSGIAKLIAEVAPGVDWPVVQTLESVIDADTDWNVNKWAAAITDCLSDLPRSLKRASSLRTAFVAQERARPPFGDEIKALWN